MNLIMWLFLVTCGGLMARADTVSMIDEIEFWVGDGPNEGVLAIDWDGEAATDDALVWGYRWDNTVTADTVLRDVLIADDRLFAKLSDGSAQLPGGVPLGTAVFGIGYDHDDDGAFALADGTSFNLDGIAVTGPSDLVGSMDPHDWYREGWDLGFWHVGVAEENPVTGGQWESAAFGLSAVTPTDGTWLSLAFTTDTNSTSAFAENLSAASAPLVADFDADGDVDLGDFAKWQLGYGHDYRGNDFLAWQIEFHQVTSLQHVVPEPNMTSVLLCSLTTWFSKRSVS